MVRGFQILEMPTSYILAGKEMAYEFRENNFCPTFGFLPVFKPLSYKDKQGGETYDEFAFGRSAFFDSEPPFSVPPMRNLAPRIKCSAYLKHKENFLSISKLRFKK
jgi:hypothetical protein